MPYALYGDTAGVDMPAGRHSLVYGKGVSIITSASASRPHRFGLSQNVPNPFNAGTTIRFHLPQVGSAHLVVYNTSGQLVRTLVEARTAAGTHTVIWDGRDAAGREVASGVYLYRLAGPHGTRVRRMVLVR